MRISLMDSKDAPPAVAEALAALPDLGLFGVVAHAEDAFSAWLAYGGALLSQLALEPRLRELAILEVARAEGSSYERTQHEGIARRVGVSDAQLVAVARGDLDDPALDATERLAVSIAREIAEAGVGRAETVAALAERLGTRELVELVLVVGHYLAIARLIATFAIPTDAAVDLTAPQGDAEASV